MDAARLAPLDHNNPHILLTGMGVIWGLWIMTVGDLFAIAHMHRTPTIFAVDPLMAAFDHNLLPIGFVLIGFR